MRASEGTRKMPRHAQQAQGMWPDKWVVLLAKRWPQEKKTSPWVVYHPKGEHSKIRDDVAVHIISKVLWWKKFLMLKLDQMAQCLMASLTSHLPPYYTKLRSESWPLPRAHKLVAPLNIFNWRGKNGKLFLPLSLKKKNLTTTPAWVRGRPYRNSPLTQKKQKNNEWDLPLAYSSESKKLTRNKGKHCSLISGT